MLAEGNDEVAVAIPIVIVVGAKVIAFTAASLGIIKATSNIQELLEANEPEIFVPEGDIDPSIPPFDLSEVPRYDPERFPNNNDFLDDILNGQYEFPDAEEGGSYFLPAEANEVINELKQSATLNQKTSSGMREYVDIPGGFEKANEIFDEIDFVEEKPLTNSEFDGRIGILEDGRKVIVRDGSKGQIGEEGQPTLEIQNAKGKSKDKFRFD